MADIPNIDIDKAVLLINGMLGPIDADHRLLITGLLGELRELREEQRVIEASEDQSDE